jgi:hypothetical protein
MLFMSVMVKKVSAANVAKKPLRSLKRAIHHCQAGMRADGMTATDIPPIDGNCL